MSSLDPALLFFGDCKIWWSTFWAIIVLESATDQQVLENATDQHVLESATFEFGAM